MMTLAQKTKPLSQGFTLIELVIVMGIIALFIGGAVSFMGTSSQSELTHHYAKLEVFTNQARAHAVANKTTQYLVFTKGKVWRTHSEKGTFEKNQPYLDFPKGSRVILQTENKLIELKKEKQHSWLISRSGVTTPMTLKCYHQGASYEMEFDPFTLTPIEG